MTEAKYFMYWQIYDGSVQEAERPRRNGIITAYNTSSLRQMSHMLRSIPFPLYKELVKGGR